jgi:hypothetical protein
MTELAQEKRMKRARIQVEHLDDLDSLVFLIRNLIAGQQHEDTAQDSGAASTSASQAATQVDLSEDSLDFTIPI